MKKVIIFGPWIGEFSYEMSWWIPRIRKIRQESFSDHYSVHVGYIGRKGLYKDFIDEYISFSNRLNMSLKYPSAYCVYEDGRSIIPERIMDFFGKVINKYEKTGSEVKIYLPGLDILDEVYKDTPFGKYIHIKADQKIEKVIKKKLSGFREKRNVVSLNGRMRTRSGKLDYGDWKPENWEKFIERLVTEMKLNVVFMGVPKRGDYPGSLRVKNIPALRRYSDYIMDMVFEGENSLEHQIALLKNTVCSIYGMSAAVILAFFVNTPVFTHQSLEHSERICFKWQKKLTDNHKKVGIFNKYERLDYPDSPADEVFEEFKNFFNKLKK